MAKSIASEFTKGLWKEVPPFRLVLGLCPVLGVTTSLKNGIGMGLATTFRAALLQYTGFPAEEGHPRQSAHRLFHHHHRHLRHRRRADDAGLCLHVISRPGRVYPPDRGQLHRPGPRRGFRLQKRCHQVNRGRTGYRARIHLGLACLGAVRELIGTGSLKGDVFGLIHWDIPNIFGASFEPFGFAVQAPGAFVILGLLLCAMNLIPSK
jgi:electron transport complex protein RnfE